MRSILYIHHWNIYATSADCIQAMRMCEGFQEIGNEVMLLFPNVQPSKREARTTENIWAYIGIDKRFQLVPYRFPFGNAAYQLGTPILPAWKLLGMSTRLRSISLDRIDLVYSRCVLGASLFCWLRRLRGYGYRVAFELHEALDTALHGAMLRQFDATIAISNGARLLAVEEYGVNSDRILVEPDGVKLESFGRVRPTVEQGNIDHQSTRKRLLYAGQLHNGLAELLCQLAKRLKDSVDIYVLGDVNVESKRNDLAACRKKHQNLHFLGRLPPSSVPNYLQSADVLLLWYPKSLRYIDYISPLKLSEYMGANRPVVAVDFPAIREMIRHEENALLVAWDDVDAFERSILRLLGDVRLARELSCQARVDIEHFTWKKRGRRILNFVLQK